MKILFPLPDHDFDVTEVAVPWALFRRAGHEVVFATERGAVPNADPRILEGVIFGQLGAKAEPKGFYSKLTNSPERLRPLPWSAMQDLGADVLYLAGGHAPGMKPYLESPAIQQLAREFFSQRKIVGAICHGVLPLARAGVLEGRRTTCLPKYMERLAYWVTAWKLGRYYRTYDAYVEDEVKAAGARFERGPITLFTHGTDASDRGAFVVEDDHYLSARWPGDAYLLAKRMLARMAAAPRSALSSAA